MSISAKLAGAHLGAGLIFGSGVGLNLLPAKRTAGQIGKETLKSE